MEEDDEGVLKVDMNRLLEGSKSFKTPRESTPPSTADAKAARKVVVHQATGTQTDDSKAGQSIMAVLDRLKELEQLMTKEYAKASESIAEDEDENKKRELLDKAIGFELQKTLIIFDQFVQYMENQHLDPIQSQALE